MCREAFFTWFELFGPLALLFSSLITCPTLGNPGDDEPPSEEDIEAFYASLMQEIEEQQIAQEEAPEEEE